MQTIKNGFCKHCQKAPLVVKKFTFLGVIAYCYHCHYRHYFDKNEVEINRIESE